MGVHHPDRVVRQQVPSWAQQALWRGPSDVQWWLWLGISTLVGALRAIPHVVVVAARWANARPNLVLTPLLLALLVVLVMVTER